MNAVDRYSKRRHRYTLTRKEPKVSMSTSPFIMDAAILKSLSLLEMMSRPWRTVPFVRDMKQCVAEELLWEYIENKQRNVS